MTANAELEQAPGELLKHLLMERKRKNSAYSLRALARDIGVSHSLLSLLMLQKKTPTPESCLRLGNLVGPDTEVGRKLIAHALKAKACRRPGASARKYSNVDADVFRLIADWRHLAILDLSALDDFESSTRWISRRLKIPQKKVAASVARLRKLGLVEPGDRGWRKAASDLALPTPRRSQKAVRNFHRQMIRKALGELRNSSDERYRARDITCALTAVDPEKLPEAKRRIQRFRRRLMEFLSSGRKSKLYAINVQLFPLTPVLAFALLLAGCQGTGSSPQALKPGTDIGSGTERVSPARHAAWFQVPDREIRACFRGDGDFGPIVDKTFRKWRDYLDGARIEGFPRTLRIARKCDGSEDLRFEFDGATPPTLTDSERFGWAARDSTGLGKWNPGTVWVSLRAPWNPDSLLGSDAPALEVILLHEWGHIFGNDHADGTIMDKDLADQLTGDRSRDARLAEIDGTRELLQVRNARYTAPFPRDEWFSSMLTELTGKAPYDAERGVIRLRRFGGIAFNSLVFDDPHFYEERDGLAPCRRRGLTSIFSWNVFIRGTGRDFDSEFSLGASSCWTLTARNGRTLTFRVDDSAQALYGPPVRLLFEAEGSESIPLRRAPPSSNF